MGAKILVINPHPNFGGGASESLIDFLNTIDRKRFDIYLMIPPSKQLIKGIKKKTKQKKFIFHYLTENKNKILYSLSVLKFMKLLLKNKIKLIYLQNFAATWKPAELFAAKILNIPIISHIRSKPNKNINKSFLKFSKLVIGNSNFTLKSLKNSKLRIKTIYNSLNIKEFDTKKSHIIPKKGKIKIGFVGRIRLRKGVMVLIEAANNILKNHNNIHLYIVGDDYKATDGCLNKAKQLVKTKKIAKYFTFTGILYDAPQFMKYMDIIVVPSIFEEPFGRVNIEAMAAEKPVIASKIGGIPEVIEHNKTGLLIPPNNPNALAAAIEKLIKNKKLRIKLGHNGREIIEKKFNSEKLIKEFENIFNKHIT